MSAEAVSQFNFIKDILQPLSLTFIGALAAVYFKDIFDQKTRRKSLQTKDAEYLCQQINEIGDIASDYWEPKKERGENTSKIEARIVGKLHGCAELLASSNFVDGSDKLKLNGALTNFRRACTSGDFGQNNKKFSKERLYEIEAERCTFHAKVLATRRKI